MPYFENTWATLSSPILEGDLGDGSSFRPPYLYKLHGSVDWLILPNDELGGSVKVHARSKEVGFPVSWYSTIEKRKLSRGYEEFIIPPTIVKNRYYNNSFLRSIWHEALLSLKESERIVVFGYSLPHADVSMYQMLIEGVRHNQDNQPKASEVVFVNPLADPYHDFMSNISSGRDGFGLPINDVKTYWYKTYSEYAEKHM